MTKEGALLDVVDGKVFDEVLCLLVSNSPSSSRSAYVFLRWLLGKGFVSLRRHINKTIGAQSMRFICNIETRHGDISSRKPTSVEVEFEPAAMACGAASMELHIMLPENLAAHEGI